MTSPTDQITVSDEQLCIFMDQLLVYSLYRDALFCVRSLEYALSPDQVVFDSAGKPSLQKVPADAVADTSLFKNNYQAMDGLHQLRSTHEILEECLVVVRKYFNEMTAHVLSSPDLSRQFMMASRDLKRNKEFKRLTYNVTFSRNTSPPPQEVDFLGPMGVKYMSYSPVLKDLSEKHISLFVNVNRSSYLVSLLSCPS